MSVSGLQIPQETNWGKSKVLHGQGMGDLIVPASLNEMIRSMQLKTFRALQALLELRSKQRTQLISSIVYTQNEAIKKRGNRYTF